MEGASDSTPDRRMKQLLGVLKPNQEERLEISHCISLRPTHGPQQDVTTLNAYDSQQEDLPYPLTREEAVSFLRDVLEIPDPLELLRRDRFKFLNTFIRNMIVMLPFTNLPHISQPMDKKHCPTFEECKRALFLRQGGHCFYKNVFSKALLDLLGFKTYHVGGNNRDDTQHDTHCGLIVCDLTHPGSLHLAETGTFRPLYEAIPLDFEEESPTYKFHFMRSKFFKREHGLVLWCAEDPHEIETSEHVLESEGTFWKVQLIYRLNVKKTRAFYLEKGNHRFGIPGLMPGMQQTAFLVGYSGNQIVITFFQRRPEGVELVGSMKTVDENLPQTESEILTEKELVELTLKHFPSYEKEMVQQAFDNAKYGSNLYSI